MFKARLFAFGTVLIVLAAVSFVLAQSSISFPYSIPVDGGALFLNTQRADTLSSALIRIRPDTGSVSPTGLATLGFRSGGVLVSETTMPATSLRGDGATFVEAR